MTQDVSNSRGVYLGMRLWEDEHRALKVLAMLTETTQKEIYVQAYKDLVAKRKAWKGARLHRFPWRASPQPGPGRKRIAVWMSAEDTLELGEWSEADGISAIDAAYTAVYEYLVNANTVQIVKNNTSIE